MLQFKKLILGWWIHPRNPQLVRFVILDQSHRGESFGKGSEIWRPGYSGFCVLSRGGPQICSDGLFVWGNETEADHRVLETTDRMFTEKVVPVVNAYNKAFSLNQKPVNAVIDFNAWWEKKAAEEEKREADRAAALRAASEMPAYGEYSVLTSTSATSDNSTGGYQTYYR